ncbi:hypothetical protein KCH_37010 [Kitasatospora cheerisanensis KCTC 2395]|uniref:Uncharacterized protein n=1 Tax=Kitasatospora cheerisanensis KCTC 2395 TaxID=1348663 RepID=A0A066YX95_9ACTN|nr:hypothetical protein KCH_37010 [Kitasatospora cheerisanensis KCTC 2395]
MAVLQVHLAVEADDHCRSVDHRGGGSQLRCEVLDADGRGLTDADHDDHR